MDLNVAPYYDDFDSKKNYHSILFRPSLSVQGRELTQMQTALQNQLKNLGDHILVDGTPVLDAKMKVNFEKNFFVISDTDAGSNPVIISQWVGRYFTGGTSGASGRITNIDEDSRTVFFDYRGGKFIDGEPITTFNLPTESFATLTATVVSHGVGVYAYQDQGIIYTNGYFVYVPEQSVMVDNTSNKNSYKIGFEFTETIITSEMDASLLDPANGAPNYNAAGADRLYGEITPRAYKDGDTIPNGFHALIITENGVIVKEAQNTQYSSLMDTMAARTYDESGNYTINEFAIVIDDHDTDNTKLKVSLDQGKAYIQGYKHETLVSTVLDVNKSRDTQSINNEQLNIIYGPYVKVGKNANGSPDINKMIRVHNKPDVNLYSGDIIVGTAKAISSDINNDGQMLIYLADTNTASALFSSIDKIAETTDTTRSAMIESALIDAAAACPIYTLSETPVKSVVLNETNYDVIRSYHNIVADGSGNFTIVADDNYTNFTQQSQNGIIALTIDSGTPLISSQYVATSTNLNNGRSSVSITITDGGVSTSTVDVMVRQHKTEGNPKTKNLTQFIDTFTLTGSDTTRILPHYDIFRVVKVKADGTEIDFKSLKLDNGQTDFYYGFGSVSGLTTGVAYEITYDYFAHTGSGDYFCSNSYDNVNNRTSEPDIYGLIPTYESDTGYVFDLRNCIDFRRTLTDNASGTDIVKPNSYLNIDYSFYISRKDRVYIDSKGEFSVIQGVPQKYPESPQELDGAMLLYELTYPAYTFNKSNVNIDHVDNRRYTMRDIGKLEKRLDIMEYYTSLSLLEASSESMNIVDSDGFTKFKNGILVDSFVGHGVGNVYHPDYDCSMESEYGILRTPFNVESFDLIQNGVGTNIEYHDHIATIKYTEEPWVVQGVCSETVNVNPYNVFSWVGQMTMIPSTDNWVDTLRAPSITTNFEGANDALTESVQALTDQGYLSTQWNSWQTNWFGTKHITSATSAISNSRWKTVSVDWRKDEETQSRNITTKTTADWIEYGVNSRTGTQLQVVPNTITKSIGDSVINTSYIPWMREKEVVFKVDGMKPNISLLATFDSVDVTTHCKPKSGAYGDELKTDLTGHIEGTYKIPSGKFRTGSRMFRLSDDLDEPTTSADFSFTASGLLETKQETILSVDNPQIVPKTVRQARSTSTTGTSITSKTTSETRIEEVEWEDPIAQSFLVAEDNGVFVKSIELFFKTKDNSLPVTVYIVENVNGYPSQNKIPFSEVSLLPSQVNIDPAGRVATKFEFTDPVYLSGVTEYSFVVIANTNNYTMFVGKIGGKQYVFDTTANLWRNTGSTVTKQPYAGVMFKSQNSSTWSADQERDVKFTINRCKFDTTTDGIADFQSTDLNTDFYTDYSFDLTTMMLNMDTLRLSGSLTQQSIKLRGGDWTTIENKSNYDSSEIRELKSVVGEESPILVKTTLSNNSSYISPVINLQRNSLVGVGNIIKDIEGSTDGYKSAGTYISKIVNLSNPSDDLRVYLDTQEVPNSKIKVSFKTTEYTPRFIDTLSSIGNQHKDEEFQIYWRESGTTDLTYKGTFVASNIDGTKITVSQLTSVNAFVESGAFGTNNIDMIYIMRTSDKLITESPIWSAKSYPVNSVVDHNGVLYQSNRIITASDGEPTSNSVVWKIIPHTNSAVLLDESESSSWREMTAENDTNSIGSYVEKTYSPTDKIDSEFSSFMIKIELLSLDSVNVPTCKALRAMALY